MLKVFLVEDEYVIRQGIKNNVDWAGNGYCFCGEAGDGELAFPLICKEKPDIVITDIKMPFMDGLELSRLVKKELPETEIIILSGYEEFEYAKEAIRIGVAEYVLKPVSGEEMLRHVGEAAARIAERHRERDLYEQYRREMAENQLKERRDLFDSMVMGKQSVEELMHQADRLELDITAVVYNIVLLRYIVNGQTEHGGCDRLADIDNEIEKMAEGRHIIVFDRDLEGKAILIMADEECELEKVQREFIGSVRAFLDRYDNISYFGGIGTCASRIRELPVSYESAGRAFAHRYLMNTSDIVSCEDLKQNSEAKDESFSLGQINPGRLDRSRIREFLTSGEAEETRYFVEEYIKNVGENAIKSFMFRQYLVMDAFFCVAEFLESLGIDRNEAEAPAPDRSMADDPESAVNYLCTILSEAVGLRNKVTINRYVSIVENVTRYIEDNYSSEELSIGKIAEQVSFTPNHLSMVFRQQTGQTLIKYLTDFRLGKAKEMLKCTNLRSSEIGAAVGYSDPHYFSYLFKKTFGMTPTQYREGGRV